MSPEELPGYAHLSRGTNNQALSESNNEYKLEAHRDVGIRPLISNFEDFVNARLFPLIDPTLAKICTIKFVGLDAETPEKESIRLQGDMTLHMTYDQVLQTVEKEPVGMDFGGEIPLNPAFQQVLDKYFTVGQILERFCGIKGASQDPQWAYPRDPFWFQNKQLQQAEQQAQMQAQQPQPPPGGGGDSGGAPPDAGPAQPPPGADAAPQAPQDGAQPPPDQAGDLTTGLDQIIDLLTKSEAALPPSRRRLLHHRRIVEKQIDEFQKDMERLAGDVISVAEDFEPKKG